MEFLCGLTHGKVRVDQDFSTHLVLSLKAPAVQVDQVRPRLALVFCIDVSSSMKGERLDRAKQSALKMVGHLKTDDYFGVVAFGSDVRTVVAPGPIGDRRVEAQKAISDLHAEGMTNFSGGMIRSLELLKGLDLGSDVIHRVIMLTDGQANVGPAKTPDEILKLLGANRDHVTCSAFGYGSGNDFSPDFLTSFAREGKGNYAHIEGPDGALKAFGTELGGLISTYATDIRLEVIPLNGHVIENVVSDVSVSEEPTGEVYIDVPEILAEETRHIVCSVKLSSQKAPGPRSVNVFHVKTSFQTFDSTGKREVHTVESKAKVQFVRVGEEDTKPNEDLDQIVGLAELVRTQLEAESMAKRGDYQQASMALKSRSDDFTRRGRSRLAAASLSLADRLDSAEHYQTNTGYLRSFSNGASRGMGVSSYVGGSDQLLGGLGVMTQTSNTTNTSNAFAGGAQVIPHIDLGAGAPATTNPNPFFDMSLMAGAPDLSNANSVWVAPSPAPALGVVPNPVSEPETNRPTKAKRSLKQTRKSSW